MGSLQSKANVGVSQNARNKPVTKPLARKDIRHGLRKEIHLEFIRLYANSRSTLHVATATTNEMMQHHTISEIVRWNSKSLSKCFDSIEAYSEGIADLVTGRLEATTAHEYAIPNTDSESVDLYINSRNSPQYKAPCPPPLKARHAQGNGLNANDSWETGADAM